MDELLALASGWTLGQFTEMAKTLEVTDPGVKLKT